MVETQRLLMIHTKMNDSFFVHPMVIAVLNPGQLLPCKSETIAYPLSLAVSPVHCSSCKNGFYQHELGS